MIRYHQRRNAKAGGRKMRRAQAGELQRHAGPQTSERFMTGSAFVEEDFSRTTRREHRESRHFQIVATLRSRWSEFGNHPIERLDQGDFLRFPAGSRGAQPRLLQSPAHDTSPGSSLRKTSHERSFLGIAPGTLGIVALSDLVSSARARPQDTEITKVTKSE